MKKMKKKEETMEEMLARYRKPPEVEAIFERRLNGEISLDECFRLVDEELAKYGGNGRMQ